MYNQTTLLLKAVGRSQNAFTQMGDILATLVHHMTRWNQKQIKETYSQKKIFATTVKIPSCHLCRVCDLCNQMMHTSIVHARSNVACDFQSTR